MGSFECTLSFIIDAKNKFIIMYPVQKLEDLQTCLCTIGVTEGLLMQEFQIVLNED